MKNPIAYGLLLLAVACASPAAEEEASVSGNSSAMQNGPQIISGELVPFEVSGLERNAVELKLYNAGKDTTVSCVMHLIQGESQWNDTIDMFLVSGDSLVTQYVFHESLYSEKLPAAFNATFISRPSE